MVVWMPVYPGYVFARLDMDGDGIHELVTCPVKARFIKFGGEISTIPDKVIHELRRLESLSMLVREVQRVNPYRPGVKVRVHTPVADIQAVIVALIRGNRLKVDSCIGTITVPVHKVNLL
jgi:transcription antitermination factor NusG